MPKTTSSSLSKRWTAASINFLTQDEMRRLLDVMDVKRDYAIFLLAYRHGLRASEVGMLRRDNLDLKQYRLRIHRLKNSLAGLHPLQPDEVKAVKAYIKERESSAPSLFLSRNNAPISRRRLDELMKHYGGRAGIPASKRHFHALKHSIATHLLDAGADLRFVQDWMGHASIANTIIYAQLTSRRRDEEARKVFTSPYVV
jgi:type 1 fimbriae regulatory protein FimB/type 1 fimbriae regulatory protein FimE